MRHLRMELHAEERHLLVADGGERAVGCAGQRVEVLRQIADKVAVTGPDRGGGGNIGQQIAMIVNGQLGPPEFPRFGRANLAPQELTGQLHPVADAQNRRFQLEQPLITPRRSGLGDAGRTARENDSLGLQGREPLDRRIRSGEQAKRPRLADPTRNQLRVLAAEVQNNDNLSMRRNLGLGTR